MSDDSQPKENRLSRWSKRKQATREIEAKIKAEPDIRSAADEDRDRQALEQAQQSHREAAEAVDLESFDESSDFSVFMKDGVPDALRRKAYRLLWRSNPVFANLDGLNDYDEDFADPSMIMKTFQSAWNVERGYETDTTDEEESAITAVEEPLDAEEDNSPDATEEPSQTMTAGDEVEEEPTDQPLALEEEPDIEVHIQPPENIARVSLRQRLMPDG